MNGHLSEQSQLSRHIHSPIPYHVVSWWTTIEDLLWPEQRVREKIERRADRMVAAKVDTVINFGFHCRFDFYPYFGALHGLLAEIAEALHQRGIRYLDHYSCNLIARPRTPADVTQYHTTQRHHVALHPDAVTAPEAGYAGRRFNDLREITVDTGEIFYHQGYSAEMMCHNNPEFLAMHEAYLNRQLAEISLDGLMQDDMCFYGSFRTCGCRFCRERFQREYGHELPPISDKTFWGDTTGSPAAWGNYGHPAFRDWVRMRYQTMTDHLKLVKRTFGPDKALMTCCSSSGAMLMNSCGLSYESFVEPCDWVMLENCGLSTRCLEWWRAEPDAMLHKAVAAGKTPGRAPAIALSYFLYEDGAYLGWAVSRFWGVSNWASTLLGRLTKDPPDANPEDAELVGPLNRWETAHSPLDPGEVACDFQVAFIRASRDNGWRDDKGRDHWSRVAQWAEAFGQGDIGYRFVISSDMDDAVTRVSVGQPLLLDACTHLSERQCASLKEFLRRGGRTWVVPPLGTHDERGFARPHSFLDEIRADPTLNERVHELAVDQGPNTLLRMIRAGRLHPRVRRISGPAGWALRLHRHGRQWALHVMNRDLQGEALPQAGNAWNKDILCRITAPACAQPLVVELDLAGLPPLGEPALLSPELDAPRPVQMERFGTDHVRLSLDLKGIRVYAVVNRIQ